MGFVSTVWIVLTLIALLLSIGASIFGGVPERILAAVLVAVGLASSLLNEKFSLLSVAVGGIALAVIYAVAMRANRIYPIWLGAIELMAIAVRLWRIERPYSVLQTSIFTDVAEFGLQLLVFLVGLCAVKKNAPSFRTLLS